MSKVWIQYKREKGVLHIGGGRFFHANKPIKISKKEAKRLIERHRDLELVHGTNDEAISEEVNFYIESDLKKMNAKQQREIIEMLGGDVSETKNETHRINLILELQEKRNKENG